MLRHRLIASALLIPSLVGLCLLDHHLGDRAPVLLVLVVLLSVRGAWELVELQRHRGLDPGWPRVGIAVVLLIASAWKYDSANLLGRLSAGAAPLERLAMALTVVVLVLLLIAALRFREPGDSLAGLGSELLVVVYTGFLMAVTAQLRWIPSPSLGYLALGSLVIAAKMGDTGAYAVGKTWGRRKLCPILSPGKTWMGGLGAVLGAALGSVLWLELASRFLFDCQPPGLAWELLFGATIGVAGLVGDLCESMMKRDAQVKDSSALLPGMGGVLDLLDSVLYAGPVAWLFWRLWPPLAGA